MKRCTVLSAIFLAFQAEAEIHKCKDAEGKIIYQGTPCQTVAVGKIKDAPKVSEEDQKRAQESLDRMIERNRQGEIEREREWQKQQEQARRLAEQEEWERQQAERERLEQENRQRYFWYPWMQRFPWFNHNKPKPGPRPGPPAGGHHHRDKQN